jgi:hypothetical protein
MKRGLVLKIMVLSLEVVYFMIDRMIEPEGAGNMLPRFLEILIFEKREITLYDFSKTKTYVV